MNQKGTVQIFIVIILVIGIIIGVFLTQNPTRFWPNAKQTVEQPKAEKKEKKVCPKEDEVADEKDKDKKKVRCNSNVVTDEVGFPLVTTGPVGLTPQQLTKAYNLNPNPTAPQIIAIVAAFDNPTALADLNTYSTTFGLPTLSSCPVSSGTANAPCFQKIDQNGGTTYPAFQSTWALEIALDTQVTHAICQTCSILLVEANNNSYFDLVLAIDRARQMGAKIISNSWGTVEFSSQSQFDSYFNHPETVFLFGSGDGGFGVQYPASSQYTLAVGGTTLNIGSDGTYLSETAWSGTGSGCSLYSTKPSWQKDTGCSKKTVADVSAVADPYTGAAIYNSSPFDGQTGWFQVGGTSLATPLIAGVYALDQTPPSQTAQNLVKNNSFETTGSSWLSPWVFSVNSKARATIAQTNSTKQAGTYSAYINITRSNTDSHVNLKQPTLSVTTGQSYILSFWAKASTNRTARVLVKVSPSSSSTYLNQTVSLTTNWKEFKFTFTPNSSSTQAELNFYLGASKNQVWLDNVSLASSATTSPSANANPYIYGNSTNLRDITSGSNGNCNPGYLCNASVGFDGPTGLGTPNGSSAY